MYAKSKMCIRDRYTVVAIGYAFTKQEGYDGFSGGLTALMSFLIRCV